LKPNTNNTLALFTFVLATFAGLELPCLASTVSVPAATLSTTLDQCISQTCGALPGFANYNGNFSSFPGTQTVGEGAFITVTGSPFPSIDSVVPVSGANAILDAELIYYFELVPIDGNTNVTNVQIGVNAFGTLSAQTISNSTPVGNNAQNMLLQLALENSGGGVVFNDTTAFNYSLSLNNGQCQPQVVTSFTATGAGTVPTGSLSCGGSSLSGEINEKGSYNINSNSLYMVIMNSTMQVGTGNDGLAHGTGTVQAVAYLDPFFTAPAGYQIELSSGIGNSNTPEPSTWSLLAAGIVLLIAANRLNAFGSRG
jgi:hypothetical protein